MLRRVALCNFNLADYSRQEDQEGVGLQGGTQQPVGRQEPYSTVGLAEGETVGYCA